MWGCKLIEVNSGVGQLAQRFFVSSFNSVVLMRKVVLMNIVVHGFQSLKGPSRKVRSATDRKQTQCGDIPKRIRMTCTDGY